MADYWIKLYTETLDDPKMAVLPDRLWRRAIEIFLLAGRLSKDRDGTLPETDQIAWSLRMSADDLRFDLEQLQQAGIVKKTNNGWLVVNFSKRQAPVTDAERKRQQRKRELSLQYHGDDTGASRFVRQNKNKNKNKNIEEEEENGGGVTIRDNELEGITPFDRDREIETGDLIKIYMNVTGLLALPSRASDRDWIIDALFKSEMKHGENLEAKMKYYYGQWIDRGYSKTNHSWLEWVLNDAVPTKKPKKGEIRAPESVEIYE